MKVIPPLVHINGTSKQELLDQRFDAIDAIVAAGDALAKTAPNGRDHYPAGPEYLEKAEEQFERRRNWLRQIMLELEEEIRQIQD